MGKSLQELGLKAENLPTAGQDLAGLPDFGGYEPPPQPGAYRFKLPASLASVWDVFDVEGGGQRIRAIFDKDAPLHIVQSPLNKANGDTFQTRLSNKERERGKKGSGIIASDMDYFLRAFGVVNKPANNPGYAAEMMKLGGQEFGADLTYSWVCSADRDIYVQDETGAAVKVEGTKGCAAKYYMKQVERLPDGTYPVKISCTCGAQLNAFANLENFSK